MNKEMELDVINSGETTEVVEHLGKSTGGSLGRTLFRLLGVTAVVAGITHVVRKHKRKKQRIEEEKVKTKEEFIQELTDEGYTIFEPDMLPDIKGDKSEDVETK